MLTTPRQLLNFINASELPIQVHIHPEGMIPTYGYDLSPMLLVSGDFEVNSIKKWVPIMGCSGQQGYDGPIMHPSEYPTEGVAEVILEKVEELGGNAVLVIDELRYEHDEDALIGWIMFLTTEI